MAKLPKYMYMIDKTTIGIKWWGVIYLFLSSVIWRLFIGTKYFIYKHITKRKQFKRLIEFRLIGRKKQVIEACKQVCEAYKRVNAI